MHIYLFCTGIAAALLAAFVVGFGSTVLTEYRKYTVLLNPFLKLFDEDDPINCYDNSVLLARLSNETIGTYKDQLSEEILTALQGFIDTYVSYDDDKKKQNEEMLDFQYDTSTLQSLYDDEFGYASTIVFFSVMEIITASLLLYGAHKGLKWFVVPWFGLNILCFILSVIFMLIAFLKGYIVVVLFISFILIPFRIFCGLACVLVYRQIGSAGTQ